MNICLLLSKILGSRKGPPPTSTYTISGTITGTVVEGVTITLSGDADDSTLTAVDGTYSFTGLVDGSYTVTPTLAGYEFTPADAAVAISGADDTGNDFVSALVYLSLPFVEDFQADTIDQQPAGWTSTGDIAPLVKDAIADGSSYDPTDQKTVYLANASAQTCKLRFALPNPIQKDKSFRLAICAMIPAGASLNSFQAVINDSSASEASGDGWWVYGEESTGKIYAWARDDGATAFECLRSSVSLSTNRYLRWQFEFDYEDDEVTISVARLYDAVEEAAAAAIAFGTASWTPDNDLTHLWLLLNGDSATIKPYYVCGIWIGEKTDAWPSVTPWPVT